MKQISVLIFSIGALCTSLAQAQSISNNCAPMPLAVLQHRVTVSPAEALVGQPIELRVEGYLPTLKSPFQYPSFYCQSRALGSLQPGNYAVNLIYQPGAGAGTQVASTSLVIRAPGSLVQAPVLQANGVIALIVLCVLSAMVTLRKHD
jgi:hypothetical protein